MKNFTHLAKAFYLLVIYLVYSPTASHSQQCETESWINPIPQGNNLTYLDFIDGSTGFATGFNGTIIKTTDGGNSWKLLPTNTSSDLTHISFISSNIAFSVGMKGTVLKTTNGGQTWTTMQTGLSSDLSAVHFPTSNVGYATAFDGTIIKTTDQGNSWQILNSGTIETLRSVFFINATTGVAVGGSIIPGPRNTYHTYVTRTTDGGLTWSPSALPNTAPLNHVTFLNDNICLAGGGHGSGSHTAPLGTIIRSTDGGQTWTEVFSGIQEVNSFDLSPDQTTGLGIGQFGSIKTTDGGLTWSVISHDGIFNQVLSMTSPDKAISVGGYGQINQTLDGGLTWSQLSKSLTGSQISSLQFPSPTIGYAIANNEPGTIIKTTDGGITWQKQSGAGTGNLTGLFFTSSATGYATSYNYPNYEILKTTNGGTSWTLLNSMTSSYLLRGIGFATPNTGIAVGENGIILRTTNGGSSWNVIPSNTTSELMSIEFFTNLKGVAVGTGGTILRTSDGGATWTLSNSGVTNSLSSFTSVNNTGYAVGDSGTILRTRNAGKTWTKASYSVNGYFSDVYFVDENTGYISNGQNGEISKTTDGGSTWFVLPSITHNSLTSIYFPAPGIGFATGNGGTLLKISTCDAIAGPSMVAKGNSTYSVSFYPGISYQWSVSGGGRLTSSGSNANINWTRTGTYTITCIPSTGQTMTLVVTVSNNSPTAIRSGQLDDSFGTNVVLNNVSVFPNPSKGNFVVSFAQSGIHSLRILNALGAEVYKAELSEAENNISLPGQLKGMFYMQISSEEGSSIQKIVIE